MLDFKHKSVINKLVNKEEMFAEPAITLTRAEMTELIKSKKLYRVWSTKLDGTRMRRVMRTGSPTGGKSWNPRYKQKGQWVMRSQTNDGEWRTIVLRTVEKIKDIGNNQFYKVR
tara:strand:+ start:22133 stop:22474 length:342 start_codon:yes stop_codon:yes gene_type:complete